MTQPQKNKIRLLCAMLLAISLPVIGMMYGMSGGFFDFILYQGLWFGLCLGCLSSAVCFWLLLRGLADWGKVKYFLWGFINCYINFNYRISFKRIRKIRFKSWGHY